jgi:hypothetical protein
MRNSGKGATDRLRDLESPTDVVNLAYLPGNPAQHVELAVRAVLIEPSALPRAGRRGRPGRAQAKFPP